MNAIKKSNIVFATIAVAGSVSAATIGLWPLDSDPVSGARDYRPIVASQGGIGPLRIIEGSAVAEIASTFTGLSSNPDLTPAKFDTAKNSGAFRFTNCAVMIDGTASALSVDRAWTVEGWFSSVSANPTEDWTLLMGASWGKDGWYFYAQSNEADPGDEHGTKTRLMVYCNRGGIFTGNKKAMAEDTASAFNLGLLTQPGHWALTYDPAVGNGTWRFFLNGELIGHIDNDNAPSAAAGGLSNSRPLTIGGRPSTDGLGRRVSTFTLDYLRISDCALTSGDFLCAETLGASHTVAYWRFGQSNRLRATVGPDLWPDVSKAPAQATTATWIKTHDVSTAAAFASLPNESVTDFPENNGSLDLRRPNTYFASKLGSSVDLNNSFTVEGWVFVPVDRPSAVAADLRLFGNRNRGKGWMLSYRPDDRNFRIYIQDKDAGVFAPTLSEDWRGGWRHLALTHQPVDTKSRFRLFVDGENFGTIELNGGVATGENYFRLGGCSDLTSCALFDTVRVCSVVLEPSKLLCTVGGTSPSPASVVAFWPFDLAVPCIGIDISPVDLSGNNNLDYFYRKYCNDTQRIALSEDNPGVPANPDISGRYGPEVVNDGSICFVDPNKFTDGPGNFVSAVDGGLGACLTPTNSFTVEFYLKFATRNMQDWTTILRCSNPNADALWSFGLTSNNPSTGKFFFGGQNSSKVQLTSNHDGGTAWNTSTFTNGLASAKPSDFSYLDWNHYAIVFDAAEGKFKLYVNGVFRGENPINTSWAVDTAADKVYQILDIGGRHAASQANGFRGWIDEVRVSSKALAVSEFLCASGTDTPCVPDPAQKSGTVAYWPLDNSNDRSQAGEALLDSRVDAAKSLVASGTNVVGSVTEARRSIYNADTTAGFVGDPHANSGSVCLSAGDYIAADNSRNDVALDRDFTLEGWIYPMSGSGVQAIVSTLDVFGNGWELSLSGDSELLLFARDADGRVLTDASASLTRSLTQKWTHVVVRHEQNGQLHRWVVFADGEQVLASADAGGLPLNAVRRANSLRFGHSLAGTPPFSGCLDVWRLSASILDRENFLCLRSGLVILYR